MGNEQSHSPSNHLALVKEAMRKDEEVEDVFRKFDRNKDGLLDRKEARLFIVDICDVVCETELRVSASWGNGNQAPKSFLKKKWKYAKQHTDQLFEIIDEDGTGTLSVEEVRNFLHHTDLKFWALYFGKIGWYKHNKELLEGPKGAERRKCLIKMGMEEYL